MVDTPEFFRARPNQLIDANHPLMILKSRMPWEDIEAALTHRFAPSPCLARRKKGMDLFGPSATVTCVDISNAGRSRLAFRIMAVLLYLKHACNDSDEGVCHRWGKPRPGATSLASSTLKIVCLRIPEQVYPVI